MCSIAVAGLAMSVIATGAGFVGQMEQQDAQDQAMKLQASQMEQQRMQAEANARRMDENAQRAFKSAEEKRNEGRREAIQHGEDIEDFANSQTSAFAGNNIDAFGGTASNIIDDTYKKGELNMQIIQQNANRNATAVEQQGLDLEFGADQLRERGAQMGINAEYLRGSTGGHGLTNLVSLTAGIAPILGGMADYKNEGGTFGFGGGKKKTYGFNSKTNRYDIKR